MALSELSMHKLYSAQQAIHSLQKMQAQMCKSPCAIYMQPNSLISCPDTILVPTHSTIFVVVAMLQHDRQQMQHATFCRCMGSASKASLSTIFDILEDLYKLLLHWWWYKIFDQHIGGVRVCLLLDVVRGEASLWQNGQGQS